MNAIYRTVLILTTAILFLNGCSDSAHEDLQSFIEDEKLKKGRVEPLPEFLPAETYAYSVHELKDPFSTWKSEVKSSGKTDTVASGIRPNDDRRKEILEHFPLDTLKMMGTMEFKAGLYSLIKAPDGILYKISVGNYVGQNHGKVLKVTGSMIILLEIVPDGLGGWEERQATLAMNEE